MQSEAIEVNVGEACFPFYTSLFLIFVLLFMIFALVKKNMRPDEQTLFWKEQEVKQCRMVDGVGRSVCIFLVLMGAICCHLSLVYVILRLSLKPQQQRTNSQRITSLCFRQRIGTFSNFDQRRLR